MKTVAEIDEKIRNGSAVVYTAAEFKRLIREGAEVSAADVDVVTTGTCGVMSGTAAILSVPVAEPGTFERAERAWANGVPCMPGPCPNERLGIVDLIVSGTARAGAGYGGGHLFRDIVEGREIEVVVEAADRTVEARVTIEDFSYARLFTTRTAYRNYTAYVNTQPTRVKTIFSLEGLTGPCREVSVSGCGEINPLQNDPLGLAVSAGTPVLLNGSVGMVTGEGTRSTPERPNLTVIADMAGMRPRYMGGFRTSAGPECITSLGAAIPVLDDRQVAGLRVLDEEISLPVADINTRAVLGEATYADVWQRPDREVTYLPEWCEECSTCVVATVCPTGAFSRETGIDPDRCLGCTACLAACPNDAFSGDGGSLRVGGRRVPITLRQSGRRLAEDLCQDFKEMILDGRFAFTGGGAR
ncbi:MAG: methanogenesis marker 16 metalloprotein [Candidatus Methanoculleus thermohydrogenotrophicum]|jgi:putative methanogenesis marker 16 metalloprotein|nr:methanogenesis marker 16 metalloprotein [Candidatus Methanoculleus thermohydrogenotrophicum]NLM82274.1 methanogenesis marker 16 metalloprotein [Candidatus Methanoculleus thermohydrogenotrophicum]